QILKLHEQYGDFVRIGSNTLSIVHPEAVETFYGLGSKCTKAAWYDLTYPIVSLQTTRDRAAHDKRRRTWSTAFSDKALRGQGQNAVNMSKTFNLFSFDVMGDLAFSNSFGMLASSEEHWAIKLFKEGLQPLGYLFPVWFFRMMVAIPRLADDWWKFIDFCAQKADDRIKAMQKRPLKINDTTASTLTHVFYELAQHPQHIAKLRNELDSIADPPKLPLDVQDQSIRHLDHLNGLINETLRLHPPVPTALPRLTPPGGVTIGGIFIPGETTVMCPQYVLGRNEAIYPEAASFQPERWYSRPGLINERRAFAPFSTALLSLRTTIAKLLLEYDFEFAPGKTGKGVEEGSSEYFTLMPGDLRLVFRKRA
ncbi:MAG: hypothetical protein Q9190_003812, partial [Brigantiaea leucoxantha]